MNGEAEARTLFRDLLVASASVPGMFPPVIVRIQQSGAPYEEAHVDGGVTVPFLIPDGFLPSLGGASPGTPATAVYVIIEGRLGDAPRWTPRRVSTIVSRSVSAGLNRMTRTTLELTASMTRVQGARLQYSAIPVRYPSWEAFDFHADALRLDASGSPPEQPRAILRSRLAAKRRIASPVRPVTRSSCR
jgi:hypothetical protein